MKNFLRVITVISVLAASLFSAHAQFGGIAPTAVNAAFIKLFGAHTTFTSQADVQVLDKNGQDWVRMPATVSALDQKIRISIDMSKAVSRDIPDLVRNSIKQSGMSEVVSIVRPDKKATFLIYPGAESYLNLALSAEDARALEKGYKVESIAAGKQTLNGKERIRSNVTVRDASGAAALEAVTWTAPELKDFPVQIETKQDNMTITMTFSNVQFVKPSAAQFDVPSGFTEYTDLQKMMFAVMKKMVSRSLGTAGK